MENLFDGHLKFQIKTRMEDLASVDRPVCPGCSCSRAGPEPEKIDFPFSISHFSFVIARLIYSGTLEVRYCGKWLMKNGKWKMENVLKANF